MFCSSLSDEDDGGVCVSYHCVDSRGSSRSPDCSSLFSLGLLQQQKVLEVSRRLQKDTTRFICLNRDRRTDGQTDQLNQHTLTLE